MPSGSGSRGRRPRPPAEEEEPAAVPVVQVASSSSDEESSSSEEEDEREGYSTGARGRRGGARGWISTGKAEAEGDHLPSCPICMNEWTADGAHRVRKYKTSHIINLYVPEIAIPNNDLEKQVLSLREKNESLEKQQTKLLEEIKEHKRQIILQQNIIYESNLKRQKMREQLSDGTKDAVPIASLTEDIYCSNLCSFVLQFHLVVSTNVALAMLYLGIYL
ncbi:hypothetical protein PR202_ga07738 [Eleusine coracana subsp. coracana]|uniref:Uncharacterized protein n=1 Tax=Eleusine coracana subsp. coracana TaxID=191504 RepID=A0AAV5C0D2_ELECO|nr:hypothetical protein PR202_ga07738 [Eleusine coracana subsp. coracana]